MSLRETNKCYTETKKKNLFLRYIRYETVSPLPPHYFLFKKFVFKVSIAKNWNLKFVLCWHFIRSQRNKHSSCIKTTFCVIGSKFINTNVQLKKSQWLPILLDDSQNSGKITKYSVLMFTNTFVYILLKVVISYRQGNLSCDFKRRRVVGLKKWTAWSCNMLLGHVWLSQGCEDFHRLVWRKRWLPQILRLWQNGNVLIVCASYCKDL